MKTRILTQAPIHRGSSSRFGSGFSQSGTSGRRKGTRTQSRILNAFSLRLCNQSTLRSFFLLILLLLMPALLSGNGGDESVPIPVDKSRSIGGVENVGEFFAEVEIRDDLLAVDEYMVRVQVHPVKTPPINREITTWPQTQIPKTAFAADIRAMIKLRGVSVPSNLSPRHRPLVETRRETERFDNAMRFVWHLVDATDHLILSNPEVVSGTEMVRCDVYFELAGTRLSLAEALVVAGHARYEPHDWGKRVVTPQ